MCLFVYTFFVSRHPYTSVFLFSSDLLPQCIVLLINCHKLQHILSSTSSNPFIVLLSVPPATAFPQGFMAMPNIAPIPTLPLAATQPGAGLLAVPGGRKLQVPMAVPGVPGAPGVPNIPMPPMMPVIPPTGMIPQAPHLLGSNGVPLPPPMPRVPPLPPMAPAAPVPSGARPPQ